MKSILCATIILFIPINIISQKTIEKTEYYKKSNQIFSKHYVLESDTTIRQGEAIFYKKIEDSDYEYFQVKKNQDRLIIAKGYYDENKQVGIWEFYFDEKYLYDINNKKLINPYRQIHYPILAQEFGKQGTVIIQYDIDSAFNFINIRGVSGDSLLVKGAILDLQKFSRTRVDMLKNMSIIIEDCTSENVIDTINYRLQ